MIIDANLYWFPERVFEDEKALNTFLSEIPRNYGTNGYLKVNDNGTRQIVIEKPTGYQSLNYVQGDYKLETMLADLDEAGVEKAVLKIPGCHEWMSLATCKIFNDGMADYQKRSGGRLVPLMVVPPQDNPDVFDEIDRCRNELGMTAVQMCAHYGDCYLDDEQFAPFFRKLNEQPTTVYVHHVPVPVENKMLCDYNNLRRSYGRCVDQATAIGREVFSGFFEKYPNLTFVHSMLGGGFFALSSMLFPQQSKAKDKVQRFEAGQSNVKEQYQQHIYFEMSHAQPWGKEQLECAVKVLGADHIVFGTSYPVRREWLLGGPAFVQALDLTDEEKDLILCKNAQRLYNIQ